MSGTGKSSILMQSSKLQMGSQGAGIVSEGDEAFNLFTHQKKKKLEGSQALVHDYNNLREAILELYLSVKIRSDDEIDDYNKDIFDDEKKEMATVNGYTLIDLIKTSIEELMNMKMDDQSETQNDEYRNVDDGNINVDLLPTGARKGLKDATQRNPLNTQEMNERLKKSLNEIHPEIQIPESSPDLKKVGSKATSK
jgi:hypothetical protein